MSGFNLPPGCNVSDIPGNEPHDHFAEKFEEDLCEKFPEIGKLPDSEYSRDQRLYGTIVEIANWGFTEGCGQGYNDGQADLAIAHEVTEHARMQKDAKTLADIKGQLQILVCIRDTCAKEYELGNGSMDKEDYDDQKKALDNLTRLINELA
jgi:hypothetical protein